MQQPDKRKVYHSIKSKEVEIILMHARIQEQSNVLSQIDELDYAQFEYSMMQIKFETLLLATMILLPVFSVPMYYQQNNIVMWLTLEEKYRQAFPKNYYFPLFLSIVGLPYMYHRVNTQIKNFIAPIVEKYDFIYEPQQTLQ